VVAGQSRMLTQFAFGPAPGSERASPGRGARSLLSNRKEEPRAAGAEAERGIRRAVEPCQASRSPVRLQGADSSRSRSDGHAPAAAAPWHFLYFLPEPHGHGSFLPTFGCWG